MGINLKEMERVDELQRSGYKIIQNPEGFCFGMDAVLLAEFARVKPTDNVLDLGTGTGVIPLLLDARYSPNTIKAIEIQEQSADMARRSVGLNRLEHKIEIITGDFKEADHIFPPASFDVVTCNPPYMIADHGLRNHNTPKTIARHEVCCTLEDVIEQSSKVLKGGGTFYLVHRPFRLTEILVMMHQYSLEPKRMKLVHPYLHKEPNMVLIEGKKGAKSRVTIEPPLIVYESPNIYTKELCELYG